MSSKFVPSDPDKAMVIRDALPNVTTLSVPFARLGLMKVGGRATIVKLTSGSLAVFSPVALSPGVQTKLQSLGNKVSYIAAPDLEHHIFLSDWYKAYPSAHVIAPEGLGEKRAKDKNIPHVPFATIFSKKEKANTKVSEEFDREFEYEYVDAHLNKELVFFHKPSKTVIQADFLWNLPATEQYSKSGVSAESGILTRFFSSFQNTKGDAVWQRRFLWYGISSKDRVGFNNSVRRVNGWVFENIVPCHGDVILGEGKQVFQKVFKWHLEA